MSESQEIVSIVRKRSIRSDRRLMLRIFFLVLCPVAVFFLFLIVTNTAKFPYPTPETVLRRMCAVYDECHSYIDQGYAVGEYDPTISEPTKTSFSTYYTEDNELRFDADFEGSGPDFKIIAKDGHIWKEWRKNYFGREHQPQEVPIDELTLESYLLSFDGKEGVARPVLSLLLPGEFTGLRLSELKRARMESRKDRVKGAVCYRISGEFDDLKVVIWIDKKAYLVRKVVITKELMSDSSVGASYPYEHITIVYYNPLIDQVISPEKFLRF